MDVNTSAPVKRFYGVWLPVPTFLAIINSIFWTGILLKMFGYQENRLEKATEWISEKF